MEIQLLYGHSEIPVEVPILQARDDEAYMDFRFTNKIHGCGVGRIGPVSRKSSCQSQLRLTTDGTRRTTKQ